jgi:hypothetical protein
MTMPACVWLAEVMRGITLIGPTKIFSQAEIQHFDPALAADHDVGRLQIAVDDAFFMCCRKRVPQSAGNLDDLFEGKSACADEPVERLTFDELHRQEVDAIGFLDRVDGDDVGMVELGEGLRLATKTREPLGIVRHFGGQYFERYVAVELRVGGAIHLAHSTGAQRRLDFIHAPGLYAFGLVSKGRRRHTVKHCEARD